ncbi:MAG: helix-turn-helix domain-containing protein [Nitrospira sp.]|nr:helix-turn-helix domain-containing protein [Nitrospira sp.]
MKRTYRNIVDDMALQRLEAEPRAEHPAMSYGQWIRTVRNYLRMTQQELAQRSQIPQSHLALIESGKIDPQIGTLQRIFDGLSCELVIEPQPRRPLSEILRGRARKHCAQEAHAHHGNHGTRRPSPRESRIRTALEKRTDEIR